MATFSRASKAVLARAHPQLQRLMNEAIKRFDFTVICSTRGKAAQELAYKSGNTKARWLQSPHNYTPSLAVDIVPYPLDWNDLKRFEAMGRVVMQVAKELKIPVRWGADWNMNGKITDENFRDYPHFELHPWRNYKP